MAKSEFKIEGLSELEANFAELGKANTRNALRKGLQDAAEPMLNDMKAYAPKATGFLEEHIIISNKSKYSNPGKKAYGHAIARGDSKEAARAASRAANRSSDKAFAEIHLGPTTKAFYGQHDEFGTSKMPAHPFMRPSWDKNKMPVLENLTQFLKAQLDKSIARLRKRKLKR